MSDLISRLQRVFTVVCLLALVSSGVASSGVAPAALNPQPQPQTDPGQESPVEVWNKTYGTAGTDVVTALAPIADGGYLVAGVTGFDTANPEAWLLKITQQGTVQWERTYGGAELDVITDIAVGRDGYMLVGARDVTLQTGSAWAARVQPDGQTEWSQTYSLGNFTIANAVTQTETGEYVVGGATGSLLEAETDAWAISLSPAGETRWNRTYEGDAIAGLVNGHRRGVTATGFTDNRADGWLVKLTADGTPQWSQQYGRDTGRFTTIHRTDRGYLLGGIRGSDASGDAWLLATDRDGTQRWTRQFGGSDTDAVSSLTVVDETPVFTGIRGGQNWVGGLSSANSIAWSRTYDTSGFSLENRLIQPSAVTATPDGGVLVAGVSKAGNVQVQKLLPGTAIFSQELPGINAVGEPRDPDGDGLYEDINGDGEFNYEDATDLAFVDTGELTDAQVAALDFDGDGDLDFDDALELAFQT